MTKSSCCTPARAGTKSEPAVISGNGSYPGDLVAIPGGKALIGTNAPLIKVDGEGPQRTIRMKPFSIAKTAVTNAEFQAFVEATDYRTEAEAYGWSFVFHTQVPKAVGHTDGILGAEWWRRVDAATWRRPEGEHGRSAPDPDHPVVHVSQNDAKAFAAWVGGRLPTEAEWEHAARGGLGNVTYPWGDQDPDDTSHFPCNIWQGDFPHHNSNMDGFETTAPAKSFGANGYGLFNMVGNTWEWTSDPFRVRSLSKGAKAHAKSMAGHVVVKGGSFLCHKSYCTRYRIAARTGNTPDSTTTHTGFRVVFDI